MGCREGWFPGAWPLERRGWAPPLRPWTKLDPTSLEPRQTNISQGHKLQDNVLAPMERWRIGFATVERQMARLEQMRLELDSRRHTVAALAADVERRRPALERSGSGKGGARLDDLTKKLRHKEGKETGEGGGWGVDRRGLGEDLGWLGGGLWGSWVG